MKLINEEIKIILCEYYLSHIAYKNAKKERLEMKKKHPKCVYYHPHSEDEQPCWQKELEVTDNWCESCKAIQPYYINFINASTRRAKAKRKVFNLSKSLSLLT